MKRTESIQQRSRSPRAKYIKPLQAFLCPLLLLLATTYPVSAANPNIVAEGGFENCGQQWSGNTGGCVGSFWQTAEGTFLMELNGTEPGSIYQDLATQSGKYYTIRFAYAGDPDVNQVCGGPGIKTFNVSWAGTQIASLQFDTTGKTFTSMGWQYYQVEVMASGSSSRLLFQSTTEGECGPALDAVSVKEVVHTVRLATVTSGGWTFYPFLNGGGSQQYHTTGSSIDTTGLQNPAPQAVYQKVQPEYSTLTINDLSPTRTYRVRVHLSSVSFTGWQNVSQNVWVSNGGSPNYVGNVNPYSGGFNRATIVDLGTLQPSYPGYSGQFFIGISPTGPGKTVIVNGVEVFVDP